LDPRFTKKKVKHGSGKVTVWGMITYWGVGRLVQIKGNMDKFLYHDILEDDTLGSFEDLRLNYKHFDFIRDNNPKYTAGIIKEWHDEVKLRELPWLGWSPDMNIIEHVWDYLKRQVCKQEVLLWSPDKLWDTLAEEWYKIPLDYIQKLYDSMPQHIQELKEANGGTTHY
jgi:hypothetical protein